MKKIFLTLFSVLLLMFASCTGELTTPNLDEDGSYGSVEIVSPRAIDGELLQYASATVTGQGISEIIKVEDIKITDGKGSFVIDKIPSGKNRIVTVQAYQAAGSKLLVSGMTLRAVFDITKGETTKISCNWETTALGNVYSSLLAKSFDISTLSTQNVSALIDESVHSALINYEKIATDIISGSIKEKSSYVLEPASLNVTVNETSSFKVQVCDPLSSVTNGSGTSVKVSNIAPGVWPVYLFDENGERQKSQTVSFSSGNEAQVSFATVTDKIIIHADGYVNCYIWDAGNPEYEKVHFAMTEEGNGWYTIEFPVTSAKVIFTKQVNGWSGQTGDLTVAAGEWWYTGGNWTSYNPNDEVPPVINNFFADKTGTISGILTLTVSAKDNIGVKTAEFSVDGTKVGSASFDALSGTAEFALDTELYSNAAHTISVVVFDVGGNKSEEGTLEFTFQNENPAPVAVITGSKNVGKGVEKVYSASSSKDKNGTVEGYSWTVTGATIISGSGTKEITVKTPDSEGKFTVSLVVKDNEGKSSESVSIEVTVKDKVSNDFREESIYFLMTARFYDGDPSNNRWCRSDDSSGNRANNDYPWRGDFKGLIEKLDYIKALGFSAIWITPPVLNRSDFDFHGYHAWNMNKIDPRLESTGATYQDLINECHKRGMKVIQDIVLNHSSRYGLEDLFVPKYWGDRDDPDWGKDSTINYYDEYNPSFTYNGLDIEPKSGKTWYNGDLWQKEKPSLPWNPDLSTWGVKLGTNNEGRPYYGCQWPNLSLFNPEYFHTGWLKNWEDETCQSGTIHEDCIDLNTESAAVQKYLIDAYTKYIEMGVDGFRVDTVKHVSRLMFNRHFIPAFKEAGGENFYMFGEVCTRVNEVWNHGVSPLSTPFYTWKERKTYSADDSSAVHEAYEYENGQGVNNQPVSDNHALNGNEYHKPDYSQKSGLDVIDFPMHWNFSNAKSAYNQRGNDKYYNDATWNVVYVDSHDYGPNMDNRYGGGTAAWAENMTYMWTFRGIPCLYYGSEIEFKAGSPCDKGPSAPLESTGRAYYGNHIEGSVTTTDFGEWSNATGEMKTTLESPLSKHLSHLNKIRRAIPALQKGQYSNEGCNGTMAFKRRFTDDSTDSFVLVTVSGSATFTGLPEGTYIDVVTGDEKIIEKGGTIEANCSGKANARIYVLTTTKTKAPGKITGSSPYLK
ncbi:MAG: alpha-amylase family glycosyl hydrolase [Spirochaetia bacterium]|nr:alpha-amylase family glycosyl hydrolase [Spirochaetia bacterium]